MTEQNTVQQLTPSAELRVGGPVIVKWPSDDPRITKVLPRGDFIGIWTDTTSNDKHAESRFMVLIKDEALVEPGEFVGGCTIPYFGDCRVYLLD